MGGRRAVRIRIDKKLGGKQSWRGPDGIAKAEEKAREMFTFGVAKHGGSQVAHRAAAAARWRRLRRR